MRMKCNGRITGLAVTAFALAVSTAAAKVEPATPFSDNMVLQRERPVPVWGKAAPGECVVVDFAGQTKRTKADSSGNWRVTLESMSASRDGRTMKISGDGNALEIGNVLVGEVWFASGQSNMECPIWGNNPRYRDGKGGIMTQMIRRPLIRYVKNSRLSCPKPNLDLKAVWREFCPASFKERPLSAVAFYYALELYGALEIPIGIVDSSWGGSRIEPWTPPSGGMWNGMVSGFVPFAMRGLIWYQGCANAGAPGLYCGKMHALYDGWSKAFENPGMKLYFAQLAPFKRDWFAIQQAQMRFAAEEKNAAIAIICDAGNLHDIHPNDKDIVAKRLALHALKRDYGFTDIIDDSPTIKSWRVENGKFILSFNDATSWYVYNDDLRCEVSGFEIAGRDGKFVPAKVYNSQHKRGCLKGSELIVGADGVTAPQQLKYLASKPYRGSLYAFDSGLPLGSFEIDAREVAIVRKDGVQPGAADAALAGYRKILSAEIPVGNGIKNTGYSFDETAKSGRFSRVAYRFELERKDGTVDWVVVAMNAFTDKAAELGVPALSGAFFQQKVGGLVVRSNVAGVEDRDEGECLIEFFKGNYGTKKGVKDVQGSDDIYDCNDQANDRNKSGYGSMQVHDLASGVTLFAYNGFGKASSDVGIGRNAAGAHADWTFMSNAALYKSRRLSVYVGDSK